MSDQPLADAIKSLLDASATTVEGWSVILNRTPHVIERWRTGEDYPSDHEMSRLLQECERIKGSKRCPKLPAALDAFWATVEKCENERDIPRLMRAGGESIPERLTRFTNGNRFGNIMRNIHRIPPRRRHDFFEAMVALFNTFTKD